MAKNEFESSEDIAIRKHMEEIFKKRSAMYYAVALEYAAMMLQWFQQKQSMNTFWNNQTYDAASGVNVLAIETKDSIGVRMLHTMAYGVYLETANDGKHSAFKPMLREFTWRFMRAVQRLGADNV